MWGSIKRLPIRNFLIGIEIDGNRIPGVIGTNGPKGKFNITIGMRERGEVSDKHLIIRGSSNDSGTLTLEIERKGLGSNSEMVCTQRFEIER